MQAISKLITALFICGLACAQTAPAGTRIYQNPQQRFQFQYPSEFGNPSPGTDDGFANRIAAIRFSEFSAGVRGRRIILGGEAVLSRGLPQLDLHFRTQQHLDPADPGIRSLPAAQREVMPRVDRMGNFAPKVLTCDVTGGTVTFDKESAGDAGGAARHIYGAVRFLPMPYSTFQLIRGSADAPDAAILLQITSTVNSWQNQAR